MWMKSKLDDAREVALRKESVDRNPDLYRDSIQNHVALRKESVDRNGGSQVIAGAGRPSLSARRAWIEMGWRLTACPMMYGRSPQGERG